MDAYVFIFLAIVILSTINCVIRIFQSRRGDSMVLQNLFSSSAEWFHCFKHCLSWHSMAAINTDLIFLFIINMQYEEKSEILLLKDLSSVLAYMIDFYHLFYFLTTRFSCFFFFCGFLPMFTEARDFSFIFHHENQHDENEKGFQCP